MSGTDLTRLATDPKYAPARRKFEKRTRTVKELFEGVEQDTTFKDKRGRPWLKNPKAYARAQLGETSNADAGSVTSNAIDEEPISQSESAVDSETDSEVASPGDEEDIFQSVADLCEADWHELSKDAGQTLRATKRLALLHFDWDNAKAENIYMVLASFLPPKGHVSKITIYPSEFGLKRMAEEMTHGPRELIQKAGANADEIVPIGDEASAQKLDNNLKLQSMKYVSKVNSNTEQSVDIDDRIGWRSAPLSLRRQIRRYQLSRLKYFYAIVEFDSPDTAEAVYHACDGYEYESSGSRLDLRFVDDDQEFSVAPEHAHLVTECHEVNKAKYVSRAFETAALHSTRIGMTWDKTPDERTHWLQEQFKPEADPKYTLTENRDELSKYLALSSSGASTAASSDVDEQPPAPTVPRIRRHRPKAVPPEELRAALLGAVGLDPPIRAENTDTDYQEGEQMDEEEEEEVMNLNDEDEVPPIGCDGEDKYDLRPVEKKVVTKTLKASDTTGSTSKPRVRRRILPEAMDFDTMEMASFPDEEYSDDVDGQEDLQSSRDNDKQKGKRKRMLHQRDRMLAKKRKVQERIEQQAELWTAVDELPSDLANDCVVRNSRVDTRFDAFLTDPSFKVSRTHPDYQEALHFLRYMRSRKADQEKTAV